MLFSSDKAERFLRSCYANEIGGFRFHQNGHITLLSTCFGVQSAHLLGCLNGFDIAGIRDLLISSQMPNGLFMDRAFNSEQLQGQQDELYVKWQFTFFALCALECLDAKPQSNLAFLDKYLDDKCLSEWFAELNWSNFWYCSNQIMFLMFFLVYEKDRAIGARVSACEQALDRCFNELDARQDPGTGFWGDNVKHDVLNGLYGAAHILMFYRYMNRQVRHADKIADTTLHCQNPEGLYGARWGGACEDYDGVEVLIRVFDLVYDRRRSQISDSLDRTLQRISLSQSENGGFGYSLPGNGMTGLINKARMILGGQVNYSYSGWSRMQSNRLEPDLWGTYFRLLTIAQIQRSNRAGMNWRFIGLPGWGY